MAGRRRRGCGVRGIEVGYWGEKVGKMERIRRGWWRLEFLSREIIVRKRSHVFGFCFASP